MGATGGMQIQDGGASQRKASVVVSSDPTLNALVVSNPDGSSPSGPTGAYATRDIDDYSSSTYTYICKQSVSGGWLFTRITNATNAFLYAKGSSDYATNFTNRALLSYGDIS